MSLMLYVLLSEPSRNIVLRLFFARVGENFVGTVELNQFSEIEKGRLVADACRLLHVVGDDDYCVLAFQFVYKLFHLRRRYRVKG